VLKKRLIDKNLDVDQFIVILYQDAI